MRLFGKKQPKKKEPELDVFDKYVTPLLDAEQENHTENLNIESSGVQSTSFNENAPSPIQGSDQSLSVDDVPVQTTERISAPQPGFENTDGANLQGTTVLLGMSSVIGRREYQQDALAVSDTNIGNSLKSSRLMAVLCDGMGGMNGGERASGLCIEKMLEAFRVNTLPYPEFYRTSIIEIDRQVADLKDEHGNFLGGGSTLISVVFDGNKLYWGSVGDSHIYIMRNNEMVLVNTEHNYMLDLMEQVKRGEITLEQAQTDKNREALISYMGMGAVTLMDIIENPFELQEGDYVILCSDGLYRSVSDSEIFNIIKANSNNMQTAANTLTACALSKNNPYQDNTSVIVIRYQ